MDSMLGIWKLTKKHPAKEATSSEGGGKLMSLELISRKISGNISVFIGNCKCRSEVGGYWFLSYAYQ